MVNDEIYGGKIGLIQPKHHKGNLLYVGIESFLLWFCLSQVTDLKSFL